VDAGKHVQYELDVLRGGVPQSGSLTPLGGTVVGHVAHRFSDFDALRSKLIKRHSEVKLLDEKVSTWKGWVRRRRRRRRKRKRGRRRVM
jgi:hypothetical protein